MNILHIPKHLAIALINLYQLAISPDHSWLKARYPYGYCRHYPSCSQYAKEAINAYGLVKGITLGAKRIIKCNPWAEPSVDVISNIK